MSGKTEVWFMQDTWVGGTWSHIYIRVPGIDCWLSYNEAFGWEALEWDDSIDNYDDMLFTKLGYL